MKMSMSACFAIFAQAFAQCASLPDAAAATVMPIWQNDTVANTLSFNDTFGHQVGIGTYNPSTGIFSITSGSISVGATFTGGLLSIAGSPVSGSGTLAFTVAGTSGGIPYFASGTTWASSGALVANQIVLGGGAGAAPSTPVGLGTTTQVLHGNAAGAPTFGAVSSADVATVLASPPAVGGTTPNTLADTTSNFGDQPRSLQSFGALGNTSTVTITIASPGVITWANNFAANQKVVFQTTGALPTGITAGTTYFVAATGLSTSSFQICAASGCGGGSIATSGSQSGVQTGDTVDTAAVQTALNSGLPLICNGTFSIDALVTVTNVSSTLIGTAMPDSCVFNLTTTNSMFYFAVQGVLRSSNRTRLENMKIVPQAVITGAIAGAPHTAAIDIEASAGENGTINQNVLIRNVQIQPNANTNYILNGVYINDVQTAHLTDFKYEGMRAANDINSVGVLFTGTHAPTTLTVENSLMDYAGKGIYMPVVAATGWQGVRVSKFDCVFCYYGILAQGSADGTSDYLAIEGLEGAFWQSAVSSTNVGHTFITNSYPFLTNPQTGTIASPNCFSVSWTQAPLTNIAPAYIAGNACDGAQATTFTGNRIGVIYGGFSNNLLGGGVGVNTMADLDIGVFTPSGVNNIQVAHQALRNVTTEWLSTATAGDVYPIPPLAIVDGSSQAAGLVGEVIRSNVVIGSAVSLSTGVPKTVTSVNLTPGDWDCRGDIAFNPNAATTITLIGGGINNTTNALPANGANGSFLMDATFATGILAGVPIGSFQVNLAATTTEYLVAQSNFGVNTQSAYGNIECRRMR